MTLKPKEPFIVESDVVLGMDDRLAVEADLRAILTGHPNFPPGVWLEWNDPKANVSCGIRLEDGMPVEKVRHEMSLISGNGECSKRPCSKQMADDIEELLCEKGKLRLDLWTKDVAEVMLHRWEERELAWSLRLAAAKSKVPLGRAIELLQEIMAVEMVMEE